VSEASGTVIIAYNYQALSTPIPDHSRWVLLGHVDSCRF